MPFPPPPIAALIMTGYPTDAATRPASASSVTGDSVPGTTGTPRCFAVRRAATLSPIARMADGGGPMKTRPAAAHASAKAAFSARKP